MNHLSIGLWLRWKVDFIWKPVMTSSVVGQRRSSKALPKAKLAPGKVMVTVWWCAVCMIHYSFLIPSETITSEKYAQQINVVVFVAVVQLLSHVSLWPHGLQHTMLPCPSAPSGACSNSCPSSAWGHPINHLILCCPLLLQPSIFPNIRVFSNESALGIRWLKYCSFSFSISSSNEYSGLISFRIDWFDLLAVQGTLKSLLQHYSSKAPILWCSVFFMVQLSHPYMTAGKTTALTRWTFVSKVMSLDSNSQIN